MHGVSEGHQQGLQVVKGHNFTITCSILPQYPGGSFHLAFTASGGGNAPISLMPTAVEEEAFTASNTTHNHTQRAVNHSAHFLFPAADDAHQGKYICVYHIHVFSHNFSSESETVHLTVTVSPVTALIIRLVIMLLSITGVCFYCKATRRQKPRREENIELDYYNLGVSSAEGRLSEEAETQDTE
ncbi:uncharacterized protein ACJ7VT_003069 [Polymixia lowei]